MATTPVPTVPVPTPTPLPGHPRITVVQNPVLAGANFTIKGSGFTKGSEVNFFVSTPTGAVNEGPLKIAGSSTTTQLVVPVPSTITLGQGFVSVVVVNTDAGFVQSNPGFALLQGSAAAGLPSITGLDGHPLATTSLDPDFAVANVETTLLQGSSVVINGTGFDTAHGAAVDVFCACPGGKLPTTFLAHGNPNLKSNSITFTLPLTTPTGSGVDHRQQRQRRDLQRQEQCGVGTAGSADNRDRRDSDRQHADRRRNGFLDPDRNQPLQRAAGRRWSTWAG